jgi:hypothetical protein
MAQLLQEVIGIDAIRHLRLWRHYFGRQQIDAAFARDGERVGKGRNRHSSALKVLEAAQKRRFVDRTVGMALPDGQAVPRAGQCIEKDVVGRRGMAHGVGRY